MLLALIRNGRERKLPCVRQAQTAPEVVLIQMLYWMRGRREQVFPKAELFIREQAGLVWHKSNSLMLFQDMSLVVLALTSEEERNYSKGLVVVGSTGGRI